MKSRMKLSRCKSDHASRPEDIERAVELFNAHGALWIEDAFDKELIAELLDYYRKRYLNLSRKELKQRDAIVGDRRFMLTVDIRGKFNRPDVYAGRLLMPILQRLLTPHLRIASFGSVVSLPGADDQPIHLDHPPLFGDEQTPVFGDDQSALMERPSSMELPPYALTMVIPLVDIDQSCGTTAIWEGSHRSSFSNLHNGEHESRMEMLQRLMQTPDYSAASKPLPKQGDVYLMDYRVIHGGLANRSDADRPILYVVYSRRWFRDGFNFGQQPPVSISPKQLKKVPKRWRPLFS